MDLPASSTTSICSNILNKARRLHPKRGKMRKSNLIYFVCFSSMFLQLKIDKYIKVYVTGYEYDLIKSYKTLTLFSTVKSASAD